MTSTFRLTRAEFKKIFKRPSVFIMALIIVATIFVSAYMFKPVSRLDNSITYDNHTNSEQYYDTFYNIDLSNSKIGIDKEINKTDDIVTYYTTLYYRNVSLQDYFDTIVSKIKKIKNETNLTLKTQIFETELEPAVTNFKLAFLDVSSLKDYDFIDFAINNDTRYSVHNCLNTTKFMLYVDTSTATDIVDIFEVNNFEEKIKTELNYASNYLETILNNLAQDIKDKYNNFDKYVSNGAGQLSKIESARSALYSSLKTYQSYMNLILDNPYPITITTKSNRDRIKSVLDNALVIIDIKELDKSNYTIQREVRDHLSAINIANEFVAYSSTVNQVLPTLSLVDELNSTQMTIRKNQAILDEKITNLRTDEATINISYAISEYSLCASAYNEYVNDKLLSYVTTDYDASVYTQFYNYKFDEYNTYQVTERLAKNKYYIDNNIYENSFINNFSFNQNSGMETNVYDFMYYTMEFCTIIIIIFAMMLMCNLITAETESGTIKLLLTRPFKRSKIVTAKLLATLFFVTVFMLFSGIISYVAGYFTYGAVNTPVLAIFNSTTPFVISPLLLMLVNIFTLLLDCVFFVLLALMLSILFKNYAGTISCVLVILIVNYVLNIIVGGDFWYSLLPGMNLHLFKYLGNSFVPVSDNMLRQVLITPIENSMTFLYSGLINLGYMFIMLAVSYSVFKKRDF